MERVATFTAPIERGSEVVNSGYFVRVPPEVSSALGAKGQLRVVATIAGMEFRFSMTPYGGFHWLGLRAEVRSAIGKSTGDVIEVELRPDLEPRTIELPPELEAALSRDGEARAVFEALSYSHRKEHAQYVAEAKKAETRQRRAQMVADALRGESKRALP